MVERPHVPVLLEAVRSLAQPAAGQVWVDCTLGFGGHSEALLAGGARVIGLDRDPAARAQASAHLAPFASHLTIIASDFRHLPAVLAAAGLGAVDGVLADLGVSSWQLDRPERGFSFQAAGPVDMRMDPDAGEPALALIQRLAVPELAGLIRRLGEEPFAGPIARAVSAWASAAGPHDTRGLAATIRGALPAREANRRKIHPATQTFQALRIAVNDELGALDDLLGALPEVLAPGGRALIISFHSLEDRRVKQTFAEWCGRAGTAPVRRGLPEAPGPAPAFEPLTRKPAVATAAPIAANPRARSARLRAVRKREAA